MGISLAMDEFAIETLDTALSRLSIDRSLKPVDFFHGGTSCAETLLADFIERKLPKYNELKNNPEFDYTSQLSPYLHFGQISPLHIYRNVKALPAETSNAFIEELLIRRELSMPLRLITGMGGRLCLNFGTPDEKHQIARRRLFVRR